MKYVELAKEILNNNWIVGVRSLQADESYEIDDNCRDSYEWDVENDCSTYYTTGETANGTCATHVDTQAFDTDDQVMELSERLESIVAKNAVYHGKQVIIAGHSVNNDGMFDEGEVRIVNAFVVGVI